MFFIYLFIAVIILVLVVIALIPLFISLDKSIPSKAEEEAARELLASSPRLQKGCTYSCPHCGEKSLLPSLVCKHTKMLKCYTCGNSWQLEYILSVNEEENEL